MAFESSVTKRKLLKQGTALAVSGAALATPGFARAGEDGDGDDDRDRQKRNERLPSDVVYIESNIAADDQNSIIGYRRAADGSLTPLPGSPFLTGGRGFFIPNAPLGPFDSDQEILLDRRRGLLYAVNSGANSVAVMQIEKDGSLTPLEGSPYLTAGVNPISLGLSHGNLVVLNGNGDPAQSAGQVPSISLARVLRHDKGVAALPDSLIGLPKGSSPTQVVTENTGKFIFTCEFLGGTIRSFVATHHGTLQLIDSQTPPQQAGATAVPQPLGLWAHDRAPILYAGFVNVDQLGVYRWDGQGGLTFLRTATNSGKAVCWLRTGFNGDRLYTTNTGDNSLSVYDTKDPENPTEIQKLTIGGAGGLVQFDITSDNRFLYVIEQATKPSAVAQGNRLRVLAIDQRDGRLSDVASATFRIPVPDNTIPQGVVAL